MTTVFFDIEQVYLVSNQGENLNITVEFVSDKSIEHPRNHTVTEWLGTMYTSTSNSKKVLGEKVFEMTDNLRNGMSLEKAFAEIVGKPSDYIYLPLYVNESNIRISTSPFSDIWDFGFIGFIAVSKKKARDEYGVKRITKQIQEQILADLRNEVNVLDDYLSGNTFGVVVRHYDDEGNKVFEDAIMGCYGTEDALKVASQYTGVHIENIKDAITHNVLYKHPHEFEDVDVEAIEQPKNEDWRVETVDYIVREDGTVPIFETLEPISITKGGVFPVGTIVEVVNVSQNYLAGNLFSTHYNLMFKYKKGGLQCQVIQTGFDEDVFDILNQVGWRKTSFKHNKHVYKDVNDHPITIGDSVLLEGEVYDVIMNPFNEDAVIDNNLGQESLSLVQHLCTVLPKTTK